MNLLAKGNTAEVFDCGDGNVCKLFWKDYPVEAIQREFSNAKVINGTSLKTPKALELVEIDGRKGIIYQKIEGKSLLKEIFEQPELAPKVLGEMVGLQKELHMHTSGEIISYKDYLGFFNYEGADSLPDGDIICHGDFHPDNVIRGVDGQLFVIDFMNLCHGPKEYDIARTFVLLTEGGPEYEPFGQIYLQMMQVSFEEIKALVEAVKFCRKKEMLG